MGVGYVDPAQLAPQPGATPYIDAFNVDQAANQLAGVGQPPAPAAIPTLAAPPPDTAPAPTTALTAPGAPPVPGAQPPVDAVSGGTTVPVSMQGTAPGAAETHTLQQAGSTPAPATAPTPQTGTNATTAPAAAPEPLGPPPEMPAPTGNHEQDVNNLLTYQKSLADYNTKLQQHKADYDRYVAGVNDQAEKHRLTVAQDAEKVRQAEQAKYQADRAKRQSEIDTDIQDKAAAAKDIEGANWAQKHTGQAILMTLLGGLGAAFKAAANPRGEVQNEGVVAINRLIEQDNKVKTDRLKAANDTLLQARYGFERAEDNHRAAQNDLDADTAAKWKLVEQEQRAQLAARGADKATLDSDALILASQQKQVEAMQKIHEREEQLGLQHEDRQAAIEARKAAQRAKHGGGGGGGGAGASQVAEAVEAGKPNSEVYALAKKLGVPFKTVDKIITSERLNAGAARAGAKEDRMAGKDARAAADDWSKQNGLAKITNEQRELQGLVQVLKDHPDNGLQQALAVEKAVSAARGGAASKQALNLALEHLGGSLDNAEGVIAKWRSGELGDAQKKKFMDFLNGQLSNAQREGKDKYDAYEKFVKDQPEDKRAGLLNERGRLFSGLAGYGGGGGGGKRKTVAGHVYELGADGNYHLVK